MEYKTHVFTRSLYSGPHPSPPPFNPRPAVTLYAPSTLHFMKTSPPRQPVSQAIDRSINRSNDAVALVMKGVGICALGVGSGEERGGNEGGMGRG